MRTVSSSHQTVSVPSGKAQEWAIERWEAIDESARGALEDRFCVIDQTGLRLLRVIDLISDLKRSSASIRGADLVFPASFGGIERGLLEVNALEDQMEADGPRSPDVADETEGWFRCRRLLDDGDEAASSPFAGECAGRATALARFSIELPSDREACLRLVSLVSKRERPEWGIEGQPLSDHVGLVEKHAGSIAERLGLRLEIKQALELAATFHDCGKDREIWQRAAGRRNGEAPLGKSHGPMRRIAGGYRHEFASLRELIEARPGILDDVLELSMHLIATHHGRGRPHFPKGGFDPLDRVKSGEVAVEVVRRFARLQRKYGYWQLAWLENLLRCADAMASAEKEEG